MLQEIYPRTIRPDSDGRIRAKYVCSSNYCAKPLHFIRAARVISKDLDRLFDYVEPSEANLSTYSFEILGLLSRVCFEVEANLKGILLANRYSRDGKATKANSLTMADYSKVEKSHFLSRYKIHFPQWSDGLSDFTPFLGWGEEKQKRLGWYNAYNQVKHDRYRGFQQANLKHLCEAFAGLIALLTSQFWREDTISEYSLLLGQPPGLSGYNPSLVNGYHFSFEPEFEKEERYSEYALKELKFATYDYN